MNKFAARRPIFAVTPDALAERGAEALRLGRFKDATEIFKQLVRQDPLPEWKQGLADSYAGRARALAEKGMFKEAAIVLENTLAGDGSVREPVLYLSCLIRLGQHQKARRHALAAIGATQSAPDDARLSDLAAILSLAFPGPTAPELNPTAMQAWAEQSRAAQAALQAWLQGAAADEIDRLLGGIPLRSPFGSLRLILKSLTLPADATAKARGLLAIIPADSTFAPAREAAEAALADDQDLLDRWGHLRPAQQRFVADLRSLPREATALLCQITDAEQRGPAALLNLLMRRGVTLPGDDLRTACLNLLPAATDRISQFEQQFGPLSPLERNRIHALAAEASSDWYGTPHHWNLVIAALVSEETPEARLAVAVVWRHLADLARRHLDHWDDPLARSDKDPVGYYLERSIAADPEYLPATLALLDRYRGFDDPKEWYHAADAAVHRFPASLPVLLHAVDAAVGRSSYKKAAGFARRVLKLDPINVPVRQRMIELQLAHARKQVRSGRADLATTALAEATEWERPDAPSMALRIGHALVAATDAPGDAASDTLRAVVRQAGGDTIGWFLVALEASLMGWPVERLQPFRTELDAAATSEPDRATILAMIGVLGQKEIRASRRAVAPTMRRMDMFLEKGSRIAWAPAEFKTIAELLAHLQEFRLVHRYATEALQREPGDLNARFYQILARAEGSRDHLTDVMESELYDIMDEAGTRQDFHLFNRVQKLLMGPERKVLSQMMIKGEAVPEELDADDTVDALAKIMREMPGVPRKTVLSLVRQYGREGAVEEMMKRSAGSGLGDILTRDQLRELCEAMVVSVMVRQPQHAGRR